jgi:hypothetical protein
MIYKSKIKHFMYLLWIGNKYIEIKITVFRSMFYEVRINIMAKLAWGRFERMSIRPSPLKPKWINPIGFARFECLPNFSRLPTREQFHCPDSAVGWTSINTAILGNKWPDILRAYQKLNKLYIECLFIYRFIS